MKNFQDTSEDNRRIARNTAFLYFRMLLLLLVGLFTSRVVLSALGVEDYGVYGAVAGVVTVLSVITSAVSTAITRYITCEIGKGDVSKLKKVFSTSLVIQLGFCFLALLLAETLGLWFLNRHMVIPDGRLEAANWVLQCSLGVLMASLLCVPFNAVLMAREKMKAFALISILEAVLKLAVAVILAVSGGDRLKLYAVLMLIVAVLVRFTYGRYCKTHFEESRARPEFHPDLAREMGAFAGWNVLGGGSLVVNTAGVNLLSNIFFGVAVNAARSVALQVDGIVKQFVTNVVVAINPQITKSYVSGDSQRAFDLVRKGSKYAALIILVFAVPVWFEADFLLHLWLGDVPEGAALFTRLTLGGLLLELLCTTFSTLILAHGDIRRFYLAFSSVSLLIFFISWAAFSLGAPAHAAYLIFIVMYISVDVVKLLILNAKTGFPIGRFVASVLLPVFSVGAVSSALTFLVWRTLPEGWMRMILVLFTSTLAIAAATIVFGLSSEEKAFLRGKQLWLLSTKFARFIPDAPYLKWKFRLLMDRKLDLRHPKTYSEKLQAMKLRDRNPLYTTLADKLAVKDIVEGKVRVVPTLGVWKSPDDIDWASLPDRFVLKCNHDSGSTVICRDAASFDRDSATASLKSSLARDYYSIDREWPYKDIPRRILAEPLLEGDIRDYKFFCFNGRPELMFIASDRNTPGEETKFDFYDMDFNHLPVLNGHPNASEPPVKPARWEEMKRLAASLSKEIPAVRVDFYEIDGEIYFGEYTFFHWSGMKPWVPEEWDVKLGNLMTGL